MKVKIDFYFIKKKFNNTENFLRLFS